MREPDSSHQELIGLGIHPGHPRVRSQTIDQTSSDYEHQFSFEPQARLASFKFGRKATEIERSNLESIVSPKGDELQITAPPIKKEKDLLHRRSRSFTKSISFGKLFSIKKKSSISPLTSIEPPASSLILSSQSQPPPRIDSPIHDQSGFSVPLSFQNQSPIHQFESQSQPKSNVVRKPRFSQDSKSDIDHHHLKQVNINNNNRRISDGSHLSSNYGFVEGSGTSVSSHSHSTPFLSPTSNTFSLERGPSSLGHEFIEMERRGSETTNATSEGRDSIDQDGKSCINEMNEDESYSENVTLPPPPHIQSFLAAESKEEQDEEKDNWSGSKKDFKRRSSHRRSKTFNGENLLTTIASNVSSSTTSTSSNGKSHKRSISNTSVGSFTQNWTQRPTSIDLTAGGPTSSTFELNDAYRFPNFDSKMMKFLPTTIADEESNKKDGNGIFKRPISRSGSSSNAGGLMGMGVGRSRSSTFSSMTSKFKETTTSEMSSPREIGIGNGNGKEGNGLNRSRTFEKLMEKLKPSNSSSTLMKLQLENVGNQVEVEKRESNGIKRSGSIANLLRSKIYSGKDHQNQVGETVVPDRKTPIPSRIIGGRRFSSTRRGSSSSSRKTSAEKKINSNKISDGLFSSLEENQESKSKVEMGVLPKEMEIEAESLEAGSNHEEIEFNDSDIDSSFQDLFSNKSINRQQVMAGGNDQSEEEVEEMERRGKESEMDQDGDDEMEMESSFASEHQTPRAKVNSNIKSLALQSPVSTRKNGKRRDQTLKNQQSESSIVLIPETPRKGINGNLASSRGRQQKVGNQSQSIRRGEEEPDTSLAFEISNEFEDDQDSISVSESESEGDARMEGGFVDQDFQEARGSSEINSTPFPLMDGIKTFSSLTGRSPNLLHKTRNPQDITWRNSASLKTSNLDKSIVARKKPDVPDSIHETSTENESIGSKDHRRGSSISWRSGSSSVRFLRKESQIFNQDEEAEIALENWDGKSTASSISIASTSRACSPSVSNQSSPIKSRRNSVAIPLQHLLLMKDSPIKTKSKHLQRPKSISHASSTSTSFPFTLTLSAGSKSASSAKLSFLRKKRSSNLSTLFDPFGSQSTSHQSNKARPIASEGNEKVDLKELERLSRLAETSWENFNSTIKFDEDISLDSQPALDRVVSTFDIPASSTTTFDWNRQKRSRSIASGMNFMPSCDFSLDGAVQSLGMSDSTHIKSKTFKKESNAAGKSGSDDIFGSSSFSPSRTSPIHSSLSQDMLSAIQAYRKASTNEAPKSRATSISKSLLSFADPQTNMSSPSSGIDEWIEDWGDSPLGLSLDTRADAVGTPTKFEDLVGQFQKRTASEQQRLKKWSSREALSAFPSPSPSCSRRSSGLSRPATSPLLCSPKPQVSSSPATEEERKVKSKISVADFLEGLNAPFDPSSPPVRPVATRSPRRSKTAPSTSKSPQLPSSPSFASPIGLGLISPVGSDSKPNHLNSLPSSSSFMSRQRCTSPSPLRKSLDDQSVHPPSSAPIQRSVIGRTPKSHPLPQRPQFEFSPDLDPPQNSSNSGIYSPESAEALMDSDLDSPVDASRAKVEMQRFALSRLGASLNNVPLEKGISNSSMDLISPSVSSNFSPENRSSASFVPGFSQPQNFIQYRQNSTTLFSLSSTLEEDEEPNREPKEVNAQDWKPNWKGIPSSTSLLVIDSPCTSPAFIRSNKISQERERKISRGSRASVDEGKVGESYGGAGVFDEDSQERSYDFQSSEREDSLDRRESFEDEGSDGIEWAERQQQLPSSSSNGFDHLMASNGRGSVDGDDSRIMSSEGSNSMSFSASVSSDFDLCRHLFQKARYAKWEKLQKEEQKAGEKEREREGECE